ncbi:MAG: hypothetical protein ABIT05_14590 [Chitinophagaceae bacterium]
MHILKKILLPAFLLLSFKSFSQQDRTVDSLKKIVATTTITGVRIQAMDVLCRMLMNINLQEAEDVGNRMILLAEESRDRKLMISAYLANGLRCSYFAGRKDYTQRSIGYYNKALEIAVKNEYQDKIAITQMRLSATYLAALDKDNALKFASQAFSIINNLDDDSLKTEAYRTYGNVYLARNEKKLALQYYLDALRIAEDAENDHLIRDCYLNLSGFYSDIEDYDKAIDYRTLALKKLDVFQDGRTPYLKTVALAAIGDLYAAKKSTDIAIGYYNRSLAMADSFHLTNLKVLGYQSLLNQYIRMDQPAKALEFFNSAAGQNLKDYFTRLGFSPIINEAYGVIYTDLGRYDSARVNYLKAAPYFEKEASEIQRMNFYALWATFYQKTGDLNKAIEYFLKVKTISETNGLIESAQLAAKHLDSLYTRTANYQLASQYNSIYYKYKDSSEKLNKEKELAQVEAADVQQRLEKEEKKRQEKEIRDHNIQYMAITIGIAILFVSLVVMGIFRVSENTIRVMGFFAFIMFFEFIILIADNKIHHLTHGEPWKVLGIKIILIAILLPLHHWLEHKMISYLTSHNRLTSAGHHIRKIFNRNKPAGV